MERVIALGFFDGVHLGHGALLTKTRQRAEEQHATSTVLSLSTHPDTVVFHKEVPLLNDTEMRRDLISRLYGIEEVLFLPFDETMKNMSWTAFLDMLREEYHAIWIVCGYDYSFGARGEGNAEKLSSYCEKHRLGLDIIPQVRLNGEVVSSTAIRQMVEAGDIGKANAFLGHPLCISGLVRPGKQLGRRISFPTVNLAVPPSVISPRRGVYASTVTLPDGTVHEAVTNIGVCPTVSDSGSTTVESHLIDFNGDLYGDEIRVDLLDYLRPEIKFDSIESLKEQIADDCKTAKEYFQTVEKTGP